MTPFLVKLQNDRIFRTRLDRTMEERVGRIVALAARKRPDVRGLGAYGCGAFGNRRETVYAQFARAINRCLPAGVEVVFSAPHLVFSAPHPPLA